MFDDQSSAVEKIYSMEVGEKEECWEEERKKEKNSVRLPSGYKTRRPTPDPRPLGTFETIMPESCSKRLISKLWKVGVWEESKKLKSTWR